MPLARVLRRYAANVLDDDIAGGVFVRTRPAAVSPRCLAVVLATKSVSFLLAVVIAEGIYRYFLPHLHTVVYWLIFGFCFFVIDGFAARFRQEAFMTHRPHRQRR
jgi:siroheme synthase (precorrin-2 oxidase/ferrochelatase)